MISAFLTVLQGNFKESYMAAFYDYFNEQKYADAVKNVSYLFVLFVESGVRRILPVSLVGTPPLAAPHVLFISV